MARTWRASGLETRTARDRLPAGRYHRTQVGDGLSLGYRRGTKARTWYARFVDAGGIERRPTIGTADDFLDRDGDHVLDFFQAATKARTVYAEALTAHPEPEPAAPNTCTVADAMHERSGPRILDTAVSEILLRFQAASSGAAVS